MRKIDKQAVNDNENLPTGWKKVKLGEIVKNIRNGYVYKFTDVKEDGIPITRIETISNGYIDKNRIGYLPSNLCSDSKAKEYLMKVGDILLSHINSFEHVGKTAIYEGDPPNLIHGMNLLLLRADSSICNPSFLILLLKKEDVRNRIRSLSGQAVNQVSINTLELYNLILPLPPLPEQEKIAEILETVDNSIEKTDKIIEKYKRMKQGLMQELLTKGIDSNWQIRSEKTHKFKDSPLGRIPADWEVKKLGEVLNYEQPTNYIVKSENYDKQTGIPVLTAGKSLILGYTDEKEGIFKDTPVIIFDDFTTESKFINFPFKVKSSALKILKLRNSENNIYFLYNLLQILNFNPGSEHKRYWISEYSNIIAFLPPLPEQERIASVLSQIDVVIEKETAYRDKLSRIKQGLMEDLLTGKVRVTSILENENNQY